MEYKKVILIQIDSILKYPPTISLINELDKLGKEVYVLTTHVNKQLIDVLPSSVVLVKVGDDYRYSSNILHKFCELIKIRKECWNQITKYYDDTTILWVMSNIAIKHLGTKLLDYRYNLHLYELFENIYYFGSVPIPKIDIKSLCLKAHSVIVCEYNRAQITKTWFHLDNLPLIITNKPMDNNIEKNSSIIHDEQGGNLIKKLEGKKIILYQGVVDRERPIEIIAKAVENLSNDFVFLVMTGNKCDELAKYEKTYVLPFIAPPYHLEITSHAYIGILIYTPVYGSFSSPLNSIYCAPNKLYEYSQFGLPMIGNNIPGLKYTIEYNRMGYCVNNLNIDEIEKAIKDIECTYLEKTKNSRLFFESSSNRKEIIKALTV